MAYQLVATICYKATSSARSFYFLSIRESERNLVTSLATNKCQKQEVQRLLQSWSGQRVLFSFFITIFRLSIPAFFFFFFLSFYWTYDRNYNIDRCHSFPSVLNFQSILRFLFAQNSLCWQTSVKKKKETAIVIVDTDSLAFKSSALLPQV